MSRLRRGWRRQPGKVVKSKHYPAHEIEHHGLCILVREEIGIITVFTCLGTLEYRKWIRKEDKKRPLIKSGHKKSLN
jgi:hypothetical protein